MEGLAMKLLILVLGVLYVISPIDLWPGILDDIACIVVMILCCAKLGVNPFKDYEDSDSEV